jgi:phage-related protein
MEKLQAIARLRQSFPDFTAGAWSHEFGPSADPIANSYEFARFVTALFAQADPKQVQCVFDQVEDFLQTGNAEVRNWVCSFLEAVQDIATWKLSGSDVFLRFLGPETRHAWCALEAIRRDLEDCSALEAEVLMWRIVHHERRTPARAL